MTVIRWNTSEGNRQDILYTTSKKEWFIVVKEERVKQITGEDERDYQVSDRGVHSEENRDENWIEDQSTTIQAKQLYFKKYEAKDWLTRQVKILIEFQIC